jgi:hypothetical protein
MPERAFKECGSCRHTWADSRSFIADPAVRLLGLQAIPGLPDSNLLVFEHRCGSSVSVLALKLRHLLPPDDQAAEQPVLFGTEACRGHCRVIENLASCTQPCANARDRRLAVLIADTKAGRGQARERHGEAGDRHGRGTERHGRGTGLTT